MILADQLTLSQPLEADYAHQMIVAPGPGFSDPTKVHEISKLIYEVVALPILERNIREISALEDYID